MEPYLSSVQVRPIIGGRARFYVFSHPSYPKFNFAVGAKAVDSNPDYWLGFISGSYNTVKLFYGDD
jgi:hypothetical protein